MIRSFLFLLLLSGAAFAQDFTFLPFTESFQTRQALDPDYQQGMANLDARRWQAAITNFDAAARNKAFIDAALYWKAYALNRAGKAQESLATLAKLQKSFPASRWRKDAQALAMEIESDSGHPVNPSAETDGDLKLLALNTLMQTDPESSTAALLNMIKSPAALEKTKQHAIFVLAQSNSLESRNALLQMARGSNGSALQKSAVRMIGMLGGTEPSKELSTLYATSSDPGLKREILDSFMLSGSKSMLATVARTEADVDLRNSAIQNLYVTGGESEFSNLYQSSSSPDQRKQILNSAFVLSNASVLLDVLKHEKDAKLRIAAIRSLGVIPGHASDLTNAYRTEFNREVRHAVLDALVSQQDKNSLTDLARTEKDPSEKSEILKRVETISLVPVPR